ncbi:MAG: hypothetical protein ABJL55_18790 [Roseibium sp.]
MSVLMKTLAVIGIVTMSTCAAASQSSIPIGGDTFIISRDNHHSFRGSHKIYNRTSEGLVEVQYCNRPYYVRYATVAWTQLETESGNVVRIEMNRGKGWRPICDNPEEQVTLKKLGVTEDPKVVAHLGRLPLDPISRFVAIKNAFSQTGNNSSKTSYHNTK